MYILIRFRCNDKLVYKRKKKIIKKASLSYVKKFLFLVIINNLIIKHKENHIVPFELKNVISWFR